MVKKIERYGRLGETDDMALAGILSTQLVHEQFVARFTPPPPIDELTDDVKVVNRQQLTPCPS